MRNVQLKAMKHLVVDPLEILLMWSRHSTLGTAKAASAQLALKESPLQIRLRKREIANMLAVVGIRPLNTYRYPV